MSELNISNLRKEDGNEGPDLVGVTTLTSQHYMVPPSGNTADRPQNPQPGTLRFNTDIGSLEYFKGNVMGWESINRISPNIGISTNAAGTSGGTGARGLWSGGDTPTIVTLIEYITISTLGNSATFGDLVDKKTNHFQGSSRTTVLWAGGYNGPSKTNSIQSQVFSSLGNSVDTADLSGTYTSSAGNLSNGIRACFAGGSSPTVVNEIKYINIAAASGTAQDFGDSTAVHYTGSGCSSSTRGVYNLAVTSAPARINTMNYITIASTGNAKDFGDLTTNRNGTGALSNATRGVWGGGETPSSVDTMDYVTLATLGNAIDFGNMVGNRHNSSADGASSPTRGVWAGGQTPSRQDVIQYITIQTTGNAADFGDLNSGVKANPCGASNGHGGL